MNDQAVLQNIASRTGGDVYIGVVGPVRTGKSTFIKRFMETLVIPELTDEKVRSRAMDELPQSGSGRTIMTAEPKFVPEEAVRIELTDDLGMSMRLVDCVGYLVPGALGHTEDGADRLVTTPWYPHPVTMEKAAEIGTGKVIREHSTMGILITCDGSFSDIPRENYKDAEARVARELRELGKPFVMLLNSAYPKSRETAELAQALGEEYGVTCIPVNCLELDKGDITDILTGLLEEFPVTEIGFYLPRWTDALPDDHPILAAYRDAVRQAAENAKCLRDLRRCGDCFSDKPEIMNWRLSAMEPGEGRGAVTIEAPPNLFYDTLSDISGVEVRDEGQLMMTLRELGTMRSKYARVAQAMEEVEEKGYGVVMPSEDELTLQEPRIVKKGGRYSVRLKATAPSIHLIKAEIETEVSPAVGGETASADVINLLLQEFEGDVGRIWQSNIFGKPLSLIAGESMQAKIRRMQPDTQRKISSAVARIVNDGAGTIFLLVL